MIALPTHAEFINPFQIKVVLDVLEEENEVCRALRKKLEKASHDWFRKKLITYETSRSQTCSDIKIE